MKKVVGYSSGKFQVSNCSLVLDFETNMFDMKTPIFKQIITI